MSGQLRARTILVLGTVALAACSARTTINSPQSAVALQVKERSYPSLPAGDSISTTSFGNYEFKAETAGIEPLYGILPLKFNGGYLALDILFFAPAMFFNLRGVFPEYEIDLDKRVIRYRMPDEPWVEYTPTDAEAERARKYFGGTP